MEKNKIKGIPNRWFYFPILVLSIYFLIRLIDQSKITYIFPLDFANDYSGNMANVYFLAKYGFHNIVPNWFGGFELLRFYHPGSSFFTLPLYYLLGNVQVAVYAAFILIYILVFLAIWILGKKQNLSQTKRIAFFLFLYANPIAIGFLLRVGALSEFLGSLFLILLFTIVIHYKDHNIDKWFLFFIPVYAAFLLSHVLLFFVSSFIVLSLFIVKKTKEKLIILTSMLISLALTSFWWIPFITGYQNTILGEEFVGLERTLLFISPYTLIDRVTAFIIPILFWVVFYFYWKSRDKSKKELVFYSIPLLLSILIFTRVAAYIPIINRPISDTYNFFFLFITIFLFLKTRFNTLPLIIKKIIFLSLIIIPIIGIAISIAITHFFIDHTVEDKETISLLPKINGNFIVKESSSYNKAIYSYAAIYHNLSTPAGWVSEYADNTQRKKVRDMNIAFAERDCGNFIKSMKATDTTEIITYNEKCAFLESCGLSKKEQLEIACLYTIKM